MRKLSYRGFHLEYTSLSAYPGGRSVRANVRKSLPTKDTTSLIPSCIPIGKNGICAPIKSLLTGEYGYGSLRDIITSFPNPANVAILLFHKPSRCFFDRGIAN